jgi:hypothetical protein
MLCCCNTFGPGNDAPSNADVRGLPNRVNNPGPARGIHPMTKLTTHFCRVGVILALLGLANLVSAAEPLRDLFLNPPREAKPRGYWVWPHGNFDYSTIRKELEAFKAKGLGGVDIFDLGIKDRKDVIPPGPGFMSVQQVDGIAFALAEAKRLGLKIGLIVSSSWNAGGTWTKPEHAYMNLVVEVANTWLNRLIADDALPERERSTHTNLANGPTSGRKWRDAQPKPSGLLGPVRLLFPQEVLVTLP